MAEFLFLLLLVLTCFVFILLPFAVLTSYGRARDKGHKPLGAALIVSSPWAMTVLGTVAWGIQRYRINPASAIAASLLPFVLFLIVATLLLLETFPRAVRVAGPRQVRFSFDRASKVIGVAWTVLSFAIPALFWLAGTVDASILWVGVAVGVGGPVIYFNRHFRSIDAKLQNQLSLEEVLTIDSRPPVLYLRPFRMETNKFSDEHNFEQFFCEALRALGPFIALGNPMDHVPPFGAVRLYASDTEWTERLSELAQRSSCILAEMARSDNLRMEYEYMRRERLHEKLFVVTAHPDRQHRPWLEMLGNAWFGGFRVGWQVFSEDLAKLGYDFGPTDPGPGSVIAFDAEARAVVLTTQATRPADFVEPIRAWIADREKVGRSVLTRCLACGAGFHVFPPGISIIRERWCRRCDVGVNVFLRLGRRFVTSHLVATGVALFLALLAVAAAILNTMFPEGSRYYEYRGWLAAPLLVAEFLVLCVAAYWMVRRTGQRFGRLYRKLADAGDAVAMTNLGIMCRNGELASEDRAAAAADWFRKAAEAGDVGGMLNLADMLEQGTGGQQEGFVEALSWYQRAADSGSRAAALALKRLQLTD